MYSSVDFSAFSILYGEPLYGLWRKTAIQMDCVVELANSVSVSLAIGEPQLGVTVLVEYNRCTDAASNNTDDRVNHIIIQYSRSLGMLLMLSHTE